MRLRIALALFLLSAPSAFAVEAITYKGKIGKIPVILEMVVGTDSGSFAARYAYLSKGVDIPLHGSSDLDDDNLTLEEEAPCDDKTCKNAEGDLLEQAPIGADWSLNSDKDGHLKGTWKDRKTGKSLPVSLDRIASRSLSDDKGEQMEDLDPSSNSFSGMDAAITAKDFPYDFLKLEQPVRLGTETMFEGATIRVDADPGTDTAYPTIVKFPGVDTTAINAYLRQRWLQFRFPAYSCRSKIYLGMGWFGGAAGGSTGYEDDGATVKIEYLTPRLLGLVEYGSHYCGGAYPNHFETRHFAEIGTGKQIRAEQLLKGFVPRDGDGKEVDPAALATVDYFEYRPTDALISFVNGHRNKSKTSTEDGCGEETDNLVATNLGVYFTKEDLVFNLRDLPHVIFACTGDIARIPLKDARPLLNEEGIRLLFGN